MAVAPESNESWESKMTYSSADSNGGDCLAIDPVRTALTEVNGELTEAQQRAAAEAISRRASELVDQADAAVLQAMQVTGAEGALETAASAAAGAEAAPAPGDPSRAEEASSGSPQQHRLPRTADDVACAAAATTTAAAAASQCRSPAAAGAGQCAPKGSLVKRVPAASTELVQHMTQQERMLRSLRKRELRLRQHLPPQRAADIDLYISDLVAEGEDETLALQSLQEYLGRQLPELLLIFRFYSLVGGTHPAGRSTRQPSQPQRPVHERRSQADVKVPFALSTAGYAVLLADLGLPAHSSLTELMFTRCAGRQSSCLHAVGFLELLVCLSTCFAGTLATGVGLAARTEAFVGTEVLPKAQRVPRSRETLLDMSEDVQLVLAEREGQLRDCFHAFTEVGLRTRIVQRDKRRQMQPEQFFHMLRHFQLLDANFTHRRARSLLETHFWQNGLVSRGLSFVDFLQLLLEVADCSMQDVQGPLSWKLEALLDEKILSTERRLSEIPEVHVTQPRF